MRIFGRDPALWLSAVAAVISALGAFVFHLTTDQEGTLNGFAAALMGIIVWRVTHDGSPALILGLVKAGLLVGAAWHFNLAPDKQVILMTLVSSAVAMFVRTQVGAPIPPSAATASPVKPVNGPVVGRAHVGDMS
jgi:hypothetical protein